MYEELLLDKENDRATERERIYITDQEPVDWDTVCQWMAELESCIEKHEDVKKELMKTVKAALKHENAMRRSF